jgi:NAD(P)-dependent dehydrogenase (short-subunit alcohol dehydrogenase family)
VDNVSLKNARVLVIGGTSGIGLGVASAAAEKGAIPIVVSRRQSSVERALAELPDRARGATVDLTDSASLDRLAADIGDIEHLVFTAGESLELAPLADLTPDVVNRFFQTRFVGALSSVRTFAPHITPGGSITLTSGTAAEQPGFGALPVSVCGAMNALTRALAFELAPIRVNVVAPGVVRTALWDAMGDADRQVMYSQAAQQLPLGRIGEVGDTARAYLYCMEQEFGTGIVLTVDGGTTLV